MFVTQNCFRQIPLTFAAVGLLVGSASSLLAAEHTLMPTPQTVHIGHFLATLKPVLTIDSGDTVTIESASSIVPSVVDASGVVPHSAVPQNRCATFTEPCRNAVPARMC